MALPTPPKCLRHIFLLYRIYFLYFEPLGALSGTCLCIFHPQRFLFGTVPLPAYLSSLRSPSTSSPTIPPLLHMALLNIASLYLLFAITEGVVLRLKILDSVFEIKDISMFLIPFGTLDNLVHCLSKVRPARLALPVTKLGRLEGGKEGKTGERGGRGGKARK